MKACFPRSGLFLLVNYFCSQKAHPNYSRKPSIFRLPGLFTKKFGYERDEGKMVAGKVLMYLEHAILSSSQGMPLANEVHNQISPTL
jgi:hypothetical protein